MRILGNFLLIIICLLFFNSNYGFSQIQTSLQYDKVVGAIGSFSKSAVFIKTATGYGSGSFFQIPFNDSLKYGAVFVATAKHVMFNKYDSLLKKEVYFNEALVFMKTKNGIVDKRKYTILSMSNSFDIAILVNKEKKRTFSEYDTWAPVVDKEIAKYNELKIGQTAFIAGYPFQIGSEEVMPVIQSGIISFVDTLHSLVLIDIPVNYGNSGCPVFTITTEGVGKFIGLVFEYEPNPQDMVFSKLFNKDIGANSSLGRVVLLKSILMEQKIDFQEYIKNNK